MNRRARRTLSGILAVALATSGLVAVSVLWSAPAQAVTLTCGTAAENVAALRTAMDDAQLSRAASIDLAANCTYLLTDADANGIALLPTVNGALTIRGHGATITRDPSAPAKPIFLLQSTTPSLSLDHVTVSGGDPAIRTYGTVAITSSTLSGNSGVVESFGGTVTVTSTSVTGNIWPVAFANSQGTLTIDSSNVSHNHQAGACGGSVVASNANGGTLTVSNSVLEDNTGCTTTYGIIGNASNSTATIEDSQFRSNSSTIGGAIENAGTLQVARSLFRGNSSSDGGAIRSESGSLTVADTWFDANHSGVDGGAIKLGGTASVTGTTFSANTAQSGAGIELLIPGSTLSVVNSTFAGNVAGTSFSNGFGGGLYVYTGAQATLTNTTFTQNRLVGSGQGSALYNNAGTITAANSLFDAQNGGSTCGGTITDGGHNVASGGCAAGFAGGAVTLLPLGTSSGGPTPTAALGAGNAAAVDQVPASSCPATDQRGVGRPQGAACDVGAWEDRAPGTPGTPALSGSSSPTQGAFTLAWSPASDPDGTVVTYELWRKDADDASFSKVVSTTSASYTFTSGSPEGEGTFGYRVIATDGNLSQTSSTSADVVVDRSPPDAPTASADRGPDYDPSGTTDDWYRDQVVVSFTAGSDPVLPDGSAGSGIASTTAPATVTGGGQEVKGSSTDAAGNVSSEAALTVRVDADAPDVVFDDCPASIVLGAAAQASWSASDAYSGVAGATTGSVALTSSTIGPHTVSSPAVSDNVGHSAHADCTYQVVYAFTGFFAPVANPPTFNKVSVGRPVVVSFSLGGDQGLDVLAAGYPQTASLTCGSGELLESGQGLGNTTLTFTPAQGGRYSFTMAIDPLWSGSCRQLIVKLADGTFHRADFKVK